MGLYTAAALHPGIVRASPTLFAVISMGTALLFVYLSRNWLVVPAGGIRIPKPGKGPGDSGLPEYKRSEREMDAILAKISEKGIGSLTAEEQAALREASEKYRRRAESEKPKSGLTL